jgi:hypothetical protein
MSATTTPAAPHPASAPAKAPEGKSHLVIDLGKKSRKSVRRLRKGKGGKLAQQVTEAVDQLTAEKVVPANAQVVVVVVRERDQRRGMKWLVR